MSWELTGNNGTNPNDNFLGTIDNEPLVIRTNNTERLRVDANGNVGMGTPSPDLATLTVNGNSIVGKAQSSAGAAASYVYDEGSGYLGFLKRGTSQTGNIGLGNNASEIVSTSGNLGLYTYTSGGYLALGTNATERLRVDVNGNVGIGLKNPTMPLDVHGRARVRDGIAGPAAGTAGLWFNTANVFGPDGIADIGFIGAVDPTRIGLYGNDPRGGSQWGFTFDTVTGNVGIGTGTGYPDAKLQVNGDILAQGVKFPDGSFQTTASLKDDRGDRGLKGDKGDKGDKGERGADGVQTTKFVICGPQPVSVLAAVELLRRNSDLARSK